MIAVVLLLSFVLMLLAFYENSPTPVILSFHIFYSIIHTTPVCLYEIKLPLCCLNASWETLLHSERFQKKMKEHMAVEESGLGSGSGGSASFASVGQWHGRH